MRINGQPLKTGVNREVIGNFELNFSISKFRGYLIEIEMRNLLDTPKFAGEIKIGEMDSNGEIFMNNFQSWGPCTFVNPYEVSKLLKFSNFQLNFGISPVLWEFRDGIVSDYFVATDREFAGFLSSKLSHPYFKWHDGKIDVKVYIGKILLPHESVKIEKLWVYEFNAIEDALQNYALEVLREKTLRSHAPLFGWESWYSYYLDISQETFLKELENANLKYEVFQLDDGYEADIGDWLRTNSKFPDGLEFLARKIKEKGMKAGIWTAPFSVSESSELFRSHPDYLVKDDKGNPVVAYENWNKKIYAIDLSNDEAIEWLKNLFSTLKGYGYEFFKIDFLFAGMVPGKRKSNLSPVESYTRGMKAIAEAVGESHILGCGAPLLPSIGYVDSMRIGADTAPEWGGMDIGTPSAKYSIRNALTRNFMNKWWVNDPDCVMARSQRTKLSKNERMINLFVPALLNGHFLESDFIGELTDEDIHLLIDALNFRNGHATVRFIDGQRYVITTKNSRNGDVVSFVNLSDSVWEDNLSNYINEKKEDEFFISYPLMKSAGGDLKIDPRSVEIVLHRGKRYLKRDDEKEDDGRDIHYYWGDDYDGVKI
ncbi:MAG: glycoside hydrolase family 36 protein [Athalassotoga sp.]|uniref:glycoside hydrolase family 36 protein n=1 Tax=Athalassotoga sp. TaxID=2022597 RepID=UPI003D061738